MNEKIVITGSGLVTALGSNPDENWKNIIAAKSAIHPTGDNIRAAFLDSKTNPQEILPEMFSQSIRQALTEANLTPEATKKFSFGLILGIGKPDFFSLKISPQEFSLTEFWNQKLLEKIKSDLPIVCRLSGNPVSACSSGLSAVYLAKQWLNDNQVDIAICAAGESPRHPLIRESFRRLKLLTTDTVRPFSCKRDGFALGEGAGAIILEKETTAKKHRAKILANLKKVVIGMAASDPINYGRNYQQIARIIQAVTTINGEKIIPDYIKAHGTGTVLNDILETKAIIAAFGEKTARAINISSLKAALGHTLSASGMVELILTIMAKNNGIVPPTLNWLGKDKDCPLNYTPNSSQKREINYALAVSLGFGGQIAATLIN